jgi:ABC-2 type transport system ATP-binding protein
MALDMSQTAPASATTGQQFAIETRNLTKRYGSSRGVDNLNLRVYDGEIFGFLGPNGAGKTTTIRMLMNLIAPTSGTATVLGLDAQRESVAIKREIGYLPGEFSLYPTLTGAQTIEYFSNLRGLDLKETWKFVEELASRLDLDLKKKFKQYSRGNKQKVGIVQAFMHRPRLLILDEPTGGLDPLNQQEFYKLVEEARAGGATIFFSSHIMSEVEKVCDRVGIIREGKLIQVGKLHELGDFKTHYLELTFAGSVPAAEFEKLPGVNKVEVTTQDGQTVLHCTARPEALDEVVKLAARHHVVNFVSREPSLEETFLDYYRS